ncbi:hypothetical protein [Methylobacterium indicum]|uniref:HNH endonuclease n=1 Tax=Methylobacterium indicum TaxID=1775910 RepID=A0ABR5H6I4_9HYPH|nr:hypothetical protein [Methylobacterium indicum]KMO17500.1 hypothetical protein QR78_17175 [Methylobacterium indicum]KMO19846.1 hypothetical protein QR79_18980 [Methylobacterium indicum]
MPIRPEHRHFYPIDWPQLSAVIRFGRAEGRCEACGRPHGELIVCLDGGTWYDREAGGWRSGRGRLLRREPKLAALATARLTVPILATCHREHDTSRNTDRDLAAWCQRCHLIHDHPEHLRRRRLTYLRRKALGDLFQGAYPAP